MATNLGDKNKLVTSAGNAFTPQGACPHPLGTTGHWLDSTDGKIKIRNADGTDALIPGRDGWFTGAEASALRAFGRVELVNVSPAPLSLSNNPLASGGTTAGVATAIPTDWPASGWIRIYDAAGTFEDIYYATRTTTSFTDLLRGDLGTAAASHALASAVYLHSRSSDTYVMLIGGHRPTAVLAGLTSPNGDVMYQALSASQGITVQHRVSGLSTKRSVSVTGLAIVVNLATDGAGAVASSETAASVAATVNATGLAAQLVKAIALGSGAIACKAVAATDVTNLANAAGGSDALSSTELFNTRTGVWSAGAALPWKMANFWSAVLPTGHVLVAGSRLRDPLRTLDLRRANFSYSAVFDPVLNRWTPTAGQLKSYLNNFLALSPMVPIGTTKALFAGGIGFTYRGQLYINGNTAMVLNSLANENGVVRYEAVTPGPGSTAITVRHVVAGLNTALSVSVAGSAVTVNLATNGAGAATSTAADVVAAVLASGAAAALVTPSSYATGNGVAGARAATALSAGDTPITVTGILAGASSPNGDILYQSAFGAAGITVAHVVSGLSTPRSVAVVGSAITVNLATDGAGAVAATETAASVAASVMASAAAAALVSAFALGTGLGLAAAVGATAVAQAGDPEAAAGAATAAMASDMTMLFTYSAGNPAAGTWDYAKDVATGLVVENIPNVHAFSQGRAQQMMVRLQSGKVLMLGGMDVGVNVPSNFQIATTTKNCADAALWDPATGVWTTIAAMPTTTTDDRGATGSFAAFADASTMNPGARLSPAAMLLPDGTVLVAGGFVETIASANICARKSALLFNPSANTWTEVAAMRQRCGSARGVAINNGTQVLVLAGNVFGTGAVSLSFRTAEVYAGGQWYPGNPVPVSSLAAGGGTVGGGLVYYRGKAYLAMGTNTNVGASPNPDRHVYAYSISALPADSV